MNSNRLGPRRIDDRNRPGLPRRGASPAPPGKQKAPDRTGLYVGLGVGGVVLILALAYAMSGSGGETARADRSVDIRMKEEIETAQALWNGGKVREAIAALDTSIANPANRKSTLIEQARKLVATYRSQMAYEADARDKIMLFVNKVDTARKNQTAMKDAEPLWQESEVLLKEWGNSTSVRDLNAVREDLRRWRATGSQDVWQEDYNRTRERIKKQHLDTGNFSKAVKEWNQFAQPFEDAQLKAKVSSEMVMINQKAKTEAEKLVAGLGSDAKARAALDEAVDRFMGTDGHAVILQKLKTLPQ